MTVSELNSKELSDDQDVSAGPEKRRKMFVVNWKHVALCEILAALLVIVSLVAIISIINESRYLSLTSAISVTAACFALVVALVVYVAGASLHMREGNNIQMGSVMEV